MSSEKQLDAGWRVGWLAGRCCEVEWDRAMVASPCPPPQRGHQLRRGLHIQRSACVLRAKVFWARLLVSGLAPALSGRTQMCGAWRRRRRRGRCPGPRRRSRRVPRPSRAGEQPVNCVTEARRDEHVALVFRPAIPRSVRRRSLSCEYWRWCSVWPAGAAGRNAMGALRESETRPRGATRTGESIGAVRKGTHKAHTGALGPATRSST